MTRCEDFYIKWRKEPNFCGMGKTSASTIGKYLKFVDHLSEASGIPDSVIFVNVPESSVRPILKFKPESDIRQMAIRKIAQTLKDKHAVTLKYVNSVLGISSEPKPFIPTSSPAVIQTAQDTFDRKGITDKIRYTTALLDPPLMARVIDVMKKKDFENEYQAVIHLIIKGLEVTEQ